jgi:hypothetical protein
MVVVRTNIPLLFRACAITVFPFIFITKKIHFDLYASLCRHEGVHYDQQKRWAFFGFGVGLLAWFALYLLVLPVYWNPFRRKWETEAFKAQGYFDKEIDEILTKAPYYLRSKRR